MKILLIDRDPAMLDMIYGFLRLQVGYDVVRASSCSKARASWESEPPDMVLVDPALSDGDGLALCQAMRKEREALVLALSRDRGNDVDYLLAGADAFLVKPFLPGQLLAHIAALARRTRVEANVQVSVGEIHLNGRLQVARIGGLDVALTPLESRILQLLLANAGETCTYDAILDSAWGCEKGDASLIRSHVAHLRKKIGDRWRIESVPTKGYYLVVNE